MPSGSGRTIAIVEDDEILGMLWRETCRSAGHEVVWLATGYSEALKLLAKAAPDILIADFALDGERDGLELLDRVKVRHPTVATILVTGWDVSVMSERLTHVDPDAVLSKPVMPGKLLECVEALRMRTACSRPDEIDWANAA